MQGLPFPIITYQVITGNYSYNVLWESSDNILKKYNLKGSIHCFSGSVEMAREFIKLGYKLVLEV